METETTTLSPYVCLSYRTYMYCTVLYCTAGRRYPESLCFRPGDVSVADYAARTAAAGEEEDEGIVECILDEMSCARRRKRMVLVKWKVRGGAGQGTERGSGRQGPSPSPSKRAAVCIPIPHTTIPIPTRRLGHHSSVITSTGDPAAVAAGTRREQQGAQGAPRSPPHPLVTAMPARQCPDAEGVLFWPASPRTRQGYEVDIGTSSRKGHWEPLANIPPDDPALQVGGGVYVICHNSYVICACACTAYGNDDAYL